MNLRHGLEQYKNNSRSVSKSKQIIMLYEGSINLLKKAKLANEKKDIQERYNLLDKFSQIIVGLSNCLDHKKGGDLAKILNDFYISVYLKTMALHRKEDPLLYDEIIKIMEEMLISWKEVDAQTSNKTPSN